MAKKKTDLGKPTVDLLLAAKAIVERDIGLGFVTEERMRLTIQARKEGVKKLADEGISQRKIAKMNGIDESTVRADLGKKKKKVRENPANSAGESRPSPSTPTPTPAPAAPIAIQALTNRELLSQSDQNDWRTPRKFLDAARDVLGGIDLDPATSAEANETVQAAAFYTEADDGMIQPWKGRVWLNPPYGGVARLFIERLIREYEVGNVTAACALVNSHPTETKWFQPLFDYAVCFVQGRIDFGGPSREVSTTSTHGSAIAYLGKDVEEFAARFSEFGAVVRKIGR